MMAVEPDALIVSTLALVHAHTALLSHEGQRQAQARQLTEVAALIRDQTPPVRAALAVAVFGRLVDCVTRLEHAAGDAPGRLRARDRLRGSRADLEVAHARAITQSLRKGPAARRDVTRPGWTRAAPGA